MFQENMSNPTLKKSEGEKRMNVNDDTKRLFQLIFREQNKAERPNDERPKIQVSDLISKMAFYYEKIRNSVDYKEENLLRKNAIERILRRLIVIEGTITVRNAGKISNNLLIELIRAGYLPNNQIPEEKIDEVARVLSRYLKLKVFSAPAMKAKQIQERREMTTWIISLAASDIEETLGRNQVDMMIVDSMYDIMTRFVELPEGSKFEKQKNIQIYLSIYRKFLKFDNDMLSFILFKYYNNQWKELDDEGIKNVALKLPEIRQVVEKQLDHPLAKQLDRIASRYTVYFNILRDVIEDDPKACYESFKSDPKAFPRQIKKMANARYQNAKSKLWRAAVRSIVYIFITKSVFAFILEVPATQFFGEKLNGFTLAINVMFPALLLFFIVLFTRVPGDDNTEKVVEGIEEIIFEEKVRTEPFRLRKPVKRGAIIGTIFGIFYIATFFISVSLIVTVLSRIGFTWVSIVIFLFFLAFVSFFSIRIRRNAKEYIIVEKKENLFSFIVDFFYIPIVTVGKWLSEKFSRLNVFVFILDFIIEAPFKIFVEIAEEWTKYVKERKEDIV